MPHLNLREEEYVNHAASLSLSCFILVRGFTVDGERERESRSATTATAAPSSPVSFWHQGSSPREENGNEFEPEGGSGIGTAVRERGRGSEKWINTKTTSGASV